MPNAAAAEPLIQSSLIGEAIDAGPVLVFVADEHRRYVAVNDCACRTLGYTRAELLALRVTDVAQTADAPDLYAQMISQRSLSGTTMLRCKDGAELVFVYRASETSIAGMPLYVAVGWIA